MSAEKISRDAWVSSMIFILKTVANETFTKYTAYARVRVWLYIAHISKGLRVLKLLRGST